MHPNKTKAKLQAGETAFGCFVRYPDAGLIELLGHLGWDFLVFDGEHGPLEPRDCEHMVRAAELSGATPIVRVTTNQAHVILRFMDTGAQGAQVPVVNSADDAKAVVQSVKYHPRGVRGLAGVRASGYGQKGPLTDYIQQANAETLVIIHIETAAAVDRISEIVAVEGVDVVFIGPTDLSQSLGFPGQVQHAKVQSAIERVVDTVAGAQPQLGIFVSDPAIAMQWQDRGARYIATSLEAVLRPATQDFLEVVRSERP
ncbi:MAG: HpcH/HpaI aldolase/citrate lyase family protein [Anaerolineae bacterium]|nr:MAG: HpcH/HpaI aldolase/citrate lyase family protein [Anaerolineae bacterium]